MAGTKFAVLSLSGYRYLGYDGTDRCESLHDGTYRSRTESLHFWGRYHQGIPRFPHLLAQILAT